MSTSYTIRQCKEGRHSYIDLALSKSTILSILDRISIFCPLSAPSYLSEQLRYIADMPARTLLRSSSTSLLDVRPSRRVTVGDRSFATAGPRILNTLPRDVTTATSLLSFRRKLKTHLFRQSYPDIVV